MPTLVEKIMRFRAKFGNILYPLCAFSLLGVDFKPEVRRTSDYVQIFARRKMYAGVNVRLIQRAPGKIKLATVGVATPDAFRILNLRNWRNIYA